MLISGNLQQHKSYPGPKRLHGFTLMEILAVITLVGLITMLVVPSFLQGPEKAEIKYIGQLIKADLELARDEARLTRESLFVSFHQTGYSFTIGEKEIERSFENYQFAFQVPEEEEDLYPDEPEETPSPSPQDTGGTLSGDAAEAEAEDEEEEPDGPGVKFKSDGSVSEFTMPWQTVKFSGELTVDESGEVTWEFALKTKNPWDFP